MKVVQSRTRARKVRFAAVSAAVVALPLFFGGVTAGADPVADTLQPIESVTSENGSKITRIENYGEQQLLVYVYSASMDKEILLDVWRPADTSEPRPTLYLLNGAGGGEDSATWRFRTDAIEFFKDKNVNVVSPVGGKWSYYTDWKNEDPELGVNKWETFLTKEIPPLIDAALGTNGVNAIAGLSSSGTSVLQLPIAAPGLYQASRPTAGARRPPTRSVSSSSSSSSRPGVAATPATCGASSMIRPGSRTTPTCTPRSCAGSICTSPTAPDCRVSTTP